ncbi:uncharacterized protein EI97DRAFT_245358 [Westerdykella ornata]|uniref:OPA3-domain-containing protein n=1 Tax=Westerdykella ornata TaxID=318751 RepID=A0A6A6JQD5_WESOR|nr:uncharacterized protein EI97DRAFT_245358 [Westerdykella ornata]KAF2278108.1 hypothetical protein EI97DRAFT_245358 [Westerdykella ornata]
MSLTLKITSLAVRTLAKPMANAIKRNAHEHERFRKICVSFAQRLHRIDMRMRLGLLQDPAVIDRQIAKEVAAAEAARKKDAIPTVKTEEETKAEEAMTEKEKEAARKRLESRKPRIRPLSEAKAIETGANFVAETFIFAVAVSVIVFEQWRQRRKAQNQRDDIREDLEEIQKDLKGLKAELEELKAQHAPHSASEKLLGFWKGKSEPSKLDERKTDSQKQEATAQQANVSNPKTASPSPREQ